MTELPLIQPTPLKLSVSKIKTFDQCAKKFHFTYILKMPRKEQDFHVFGKLLHKALEDFHQLYIKGWLLPANEAMKVAWQAAKAEFADKMTPQAIKDAFDILSKYLKLVASNPPTYLTNVLSTEEPFNFELTNNIILNGVIDKVSTDDDGMVHISDYKSTKDKRYLKDDWFQLMTYAFVVMHNKPEIERVRVSYVLLRHDFEHISKEVSREEAEAVKGEYERFAADIENEKEYQATVSNLCRWCDHLEICPQGLKSIGKEVRHGEIDW
jgi:RecB family exonuclease